LTAGDEVHDSPVGWVNQHIRGYVESDGEKGHRWRGVNTLLLTTRGRKSGKFRRTALIYGRDADSYVIVASKGGANKHPEWYLNLAANPDVEVQVGSDKFKARARTATPEEKPKLWRVMTSIWPDYDNYQKRTKRKIPVVVLERVAGA
jgi:deazaflavin-dependent oxidoreductase (nitroreductase family)